jgi:hypothetical protein
MARGWESKSVEAQIDSVEPRRKHMPVISVSAEIIQRQRERESLQLSRTRVKRDLESATHQRYRDSLQAALQHLDDKLAALA